jgi:hypothetical protein
MGIDASVVSVVAVVVFGYVLTLIIVKKGDFEAGGRTPTGEFFVKAKERKKAKKPKNKK